MGSDAALRAMDLPNPCCALWNTRYSKMEEKRNALRQGVQILKGQIDRLQEDKVNLKKAYDEEYARANVNEEEKGKEASLRISMEKEIAALKSEMFSTKYDTVSGNEDLNKEITLLQTSISVREAEIDRLKQLLTEEGRVAAKKEKADLETTMTTELWETLQYEKSKTEEASKRADALEKEVAALKFEISTSSLEPVSETEDLNKEVTLLQACISEKELEIDRLRKILIEEERKADDEKHCADLERNKVVELQKALAYEKSRADESSKMADILAKKAEENRVQLETLKNEIDKRRLEYEEAKKKLKAEKQKAIKENKRADEEKVKAEEQRRIAEANEKKLAGEKSCSNNLLMQLEEKQQNVEEAKKKLEAEKEKAIKEKTRANEEKARAIEQRRIAEAHEKKLVEEKSRCYNLLMQLEEKNQSVEKLQKELQDLTSTHTSAYFSDLDEVKRNLEVEMKRCARENKCTEDEMLKTEEQRKIAEASTNKAIEEKHRADKLFQELQSSRQRVEYIEKQLQEMSNMLEAERKKAYIEEKRADAEKSKSAEQERAAAEKGRMATEEKFQADTLCRELESNKKKIQNMENELQELKSTGKLGETSNVLPVLNEQTSELQFLRKQLKFEKQRVKHAKEVSELEKNRNIMLQEELLNVRQGVECLFHRLDLLTDIGARNGTKKLGLSDVHTGLLSSRMFPSHMYLRGDAECRISSLSSKDASSCQFKENGKFLAARHRMQSPSASFSDEQLVGSQERVARSLTASVVVAQENTNLQATAPKCSRKFRKRKNGEKIGIVAENSMRSPVDSTTDSVVKRRKILDELDSIKSMQLQGKKVFEEAEKKLSALHTTLGQPMIEQMEMENFQLPVHADTTLGQPMIEQMEMENFQLPVHADTSLDISYQPGGKSKASYEPDSTCLHFDASTVQTEVEKHEVNLTASERPENSQLVQVACGDMVKCNQNIKSFEELMNGDYMKLLNLDSAVDEECFQTAMERPLSPTLPSIDVCNSESSIDAQMLSMHALNSNEAVDQHGGFIFEKNQLYCVLYSDMEDSGCVSRIYSAVRTCLVRCRLLFCTDWRVHDIVASVVLEKDLRPREKVCALFSLILLNLSKVSSRKVEELQNKGLLNSFCAHICTVLSSMETRRIFSEICHISDLLSLFEDFVLCRRIFVQSNATSGSLHDSSSSFEILHDNKKVILTPNAASIDLVMAGSVTLASICTAIGHVDYLCEVSFNIFRVYRTEDQMVLKILHMFAYVCGQEFYSSSNYNFMKVVKSVITFAERNFANTSSMVLQSGNVSEPCFIPCVRCPFSDSSLSLDDVSAMLLEELQCFCSGNNLHKDSAEQAHLPTMEALLYNMGDTLSSLELIVSIMGWDWACDKIMPELLKMLESSCDQGMVSSTALVGLLGELGRLGVKESGYDDVGVESIRCQLSNIVCRGDTLKCNSLTMAIHTALSGLHQKDREDFVNSNVKLPSKNGGYPALATISSEQVSSLFGR